VWQQKQKQNDDTDRSKYIGHEYKYQINAYDCGGGEADRSYARIGDTKEIMNTSTP
jgi:hypothetical protein